MEFINQSPIGESSRSNPVTYVKAYDYIRELFAKQQLSKIRGFQPKHFSFNAEGSRCEPCKGEGEQIVEMQFLADEWSSMTGNFHCPSMSIFGEAFWRLANSSSASSSERKRSSFGWFTFYGRWTLDSLIELNGD